MSMINARWRSCASSRLIAKLAVTLGSLRGLSGQFDMICTGPFKLARSSSSLEMILSEFLIIKEIYFKTY